MEQDEDQDNKRKRGVASGPVGKRQKLPLDKEKTPERPRRAAAHYKPN